MKRKVFAHAKTENIIGAFLEASPVHHKDLACASLTSYLILIDSITLILMALFSQAIKNKAGLNISRWAHTQ